MVFTPKTVKVFLRRPPSTIRRSRRFMSARPDEAPFRSRSGFVTAVASGRAPGDSRDSQWDVAKPVRQHAAWNGV